MARSGRTSNEIGDSTERRAADILQGSRVTQSGGGTFIKLDVKDAAKFIYSCKATETIRDTALRAINKLWKEAKRGARGFQGHGDEARPAMIFELDGELLILCRLEDHAALATGEIAPYIKPDKATERRLRGTRSLLG